MLLTLIGHIICKQDGKNLFEDGETYLIVAIAEVVTWAIITPW